MTSIHWRNWQKLLAAWGRREDKLQIADSHRTALDNARICFTEYGDDFGMTDVTMTVKMSYDASLLGRGGSEIDGQQFLQTAFPKRGFSSSNSKFVDPTSQARASAARYSASNWGSILP